MKLSDRFLHGLMIQETVSQARPFLYQQVNIYNIFEVYVLMRFFLFSLGGYKYVDFIMFFFPLRKTCYKNKKFKFHDMYSQQ